MADSLTTLTRRVLFAPLDEPGRTETVVSRIRSAITLGIYANGEQLPSEIDLAAQLSISPVTLRDALKVVREEGLVRTTRGRSGGTFVIAPDESNMRFFESSLAQLTPIELRDLLDWQTALTGQAAILATERASAHDIQTLEATASRLRDAEDPISARRANSRFLIELAASSRSSRISKASITMQIEFSPHAMLVFRDRGARAGTSVLARQLVEAVAARETEQAHAAANRLNDFLGEGITHLHHALREREGGVAGPETGSMSAVTAETGGRP
ncbi:FadR/GntR family transcriptional regulator [Salinibacterium hongtaonis]|uniref:FadR/GntR family transcriptional regulator n=1 Tax=Homoserinimonas hongtaonis TaxID=2079791 RepID=UPI000D33E8A0|nr:GntR family transcriptional regulator [Salinibacterium hongtaonis]AWB89038.1 GntR family transcriptional regulator [Salinibacterium hongtaonis]